MAEDDKSKKPADDAKEDDTTPGATAPEDGSDTIGAAEDDSLAGDDSVTSTPTSDTDDDAVAASGDSTPADETVTPGGEEPEMALSPAERATMPGSYSSYESSDTVTGGGRDDTLAENDSLATSEQADTLAGETATARTGADTVMPGRETDRRDTHGSVPPSSGTPSGPAQTERTVERRGGFFSAFLGGLVAAVLGFLLAQYLGPNGWPFSNDSAVFEDETRSGLEDLGGRVEGLESDLSEIDLSSVDTAVSDLADRSTAMEQGLSDLSGRVETLSGRVDTLATDIEALRGDIGTISEDSGSLNERLTTLEKRPIEETVSPDAIEAYERELNALQESVSEQRQQMEASAEEQRNAVESAIADQRAALEAQRAEIEKMVEEAQSSEEDAAEQAQLARLRAALADLVAAVQSGGDISEELAPITDADAVEVPEALTARAESGVPTQAALVEAFPDAARDGLAAARSAQEGAGNRVAAFFERQLGMRSVTPREGDSPDAILSRAEAAVRSGDLETALTEISALPQPAQDAMSGWIGEARARADALSAANTLAQDLNQE